MKKALSIFVLIVILLVNTTCYASPVSPSILNLYKTNPFIELEFLTQKKTNLDLEYWEPYKIIDEQERFYASKDFILIDALLLHLKDPLNVVEFEFPYFFDFESNLVVMVLINEEEMSWVRQGNVTENGTVFFDFTDVPPEDTIMYILCKEF